ncbi:ABC transporter substrate-binding protein [Pantoea sp. 18069]|uniref:ABC transporter substrate-binding protein n=1 Tax=Pantoea sp. 18069 TaxID=2681415 RepID=UPI001357B3FD|nr:NrtA/SsuA/CpmA family ABC transporter substrate-binding protein [Pantoea sp. 18069]
MPAIFAASEGHSWAVPFVADAQKLWAQEGLDVSNLAFTSGRLSAEAVLAGKADFATTTDSVVALAALQGHKIKVFAEFANSSTQMLVAARRDQGITQPSDLRGKRFATMFGTAGHYFVNRYLRLHGLTPKDVTVINLRPPEMISALAQGSIDAFAWDWWAAEDAAKVEGKGNVQVLSSAGIDKVFQSHFVLVTNEQTAQAKPQVLEAAVRALIGAEQQLAADPEKGAQILAARTRGSIESSRNGLARNATRVQLAPRLLDDLVLGGQWAITEKLAQDNAADLRALYRQVIDTRALRAVAPERVQLA